MRSDGFSHKRTDRMHDSIHFRGIYRCSILDIGTVELCENFQEVKNQRDKRSFCMSVLLNSFMKEKYYRKFTNKFPFCKRLFRKSSIYFQFVIILGNVMEFFFIRCKVITHCYFCSLYV